MEKLQNDTKKILSEGEQFQEFIKSDGWKTARRKLTDKLILLDSISAMPKDGSDTAIVKEMKVREGVNSIIIEWLKEIEGLAEQNNFNSTEFLAKDKKNAIVQNLE